ncbi:Rrf2 family transcriptional regulator [Nocardioides sp. InS609-2]|uniref:RrF2 family transcriptional regulator n=1 Tax=Nocardioides sp. InS609-2 TaxID=2760705 RepID=UPI0020BF4DB8|nr:Rrf2 family transcriptional regulator [Nocardioides sp. InS609-2]
MRISEGVEWAAHCAVVLAQLPDGLALNAGVLAEFHGVPKPYLAKSLQALSRAGIVASSQGRNGGYSLARPAGEVTLLDIVLAVDGGQAAFRCTEIRQRAPHPAPRKCFRSSCAIAAGMWRAEQAWRDELATVRLDALASGVAEIVPDDVMAQNAGWLAARIGRA